MTFRKDLSRLKPTDRPSGLRVTALRWVECGAKALPDGWRVNVSLSQRWDLTRGSTPCSDPLSRLRPCSDPSLASWKVAEAGRKVRERTWRPNPTPWLLPGSTSLSAAQDAIGLERYKTCKLVAIEKDTYLNRQSYLTCLAASTSLITSHLSALSTSHAKPLIWHTRCAKCACRTVRNGLIWGLHL
jgi:hypothetical protein